MILLFDPKSLQNINSDDTREKLQETLRKFNEADEELTRICKELGIEKPELVCKGE